MTEKERNRVVEALSMGMVEAVFVLCDQSRDDSAIVLNLLAEALEEESTNDFLIANNKGTTG